MARPKRHGVRCSGAWGAAPKWFHHADVRQQPRVWSANGAWARRARSVIYHLPSGGTLKGKCGGRVAHACAALQLQTPTPPIGCPATNRTVAAAPPPRRRRAALQVYALVLPRPDLRCLVIVGHLSPPSSGSALLLGTSSAGGDMAATRVQRRGVARAAPLLAFLAAAAAATTARGARLDLGGRRSVERRGSPSPPAWPAAFEMEYTLSLPYVLTLQSVGLKCAHMINGATRGRQQGRRGEGMDEERGGDGCLYSLRALRDRQGCRVGHGCCNS
eukprot:95949-Chlamydomonas_euryale.AAC.2